VEFSQCKVSWRLALTSLVVGVLALFSLVPGAWASPNQRGMRQTVPTRTPTEAATNTSVPPTATPVSPTATPVPPTATPPPSDAYASPETTPPSSTPRPTSTSMPPTATTEPTSSPTATTVPTSSPAALKVAATPLDTPASAAPTVGMLEATSRPQLATSSPPTAEGELQLPVVEARATMETSSQDQGEAEETALLPYLVSAGALLLLGGAVYAVWRRRASSGL